MLINRYPGFMKYIIYKTSIILGHQSELSIKWIKCLRNTKVLKAFF